MAVRACVRACVRAGARTRACVCARVCARACVIHICDKEREGATGSETQTETGTGTVLDSDNGVPILIKEYFGQKAVGHTSVLDAVNMNLKDWILFYTAQAPTPLFSAQSPMATRLVIAHPVIGDWILFHTAQAPLYTARAPSLHRS